MTVKNDGVHVGDPIEILMLRFDDSVVRRSWVPATVQYIDEHKITAVTSDFVRKDIPRRHQERQWRVSR